ncbi:transcription factor IIIB 50 kDa subunit [Sardina pilchardus]|uniref:transcription factor IIIB 50 kDa subunit n=1 Tax=Sardina pilchardus TaxID=27697 RepID=UPI002E151605
MPTCTECGSTKVVEDDLYSERTLVCEDCGSVVAAEQLTTTRSEEEQGTSVPYYASTEVTKKPCRNLIKGIKRVRALCRIFRFPGDMEARTVELFQQAYAHPTFLPVRMDKKELLAGACMVAVARMSNWPVAMGTVSSLMEADGTLLGTVYQDLVQSLHLQATGASVTDLLENYCHGLKLTVDVVGAEFAETPQRLTERATALVELAGDTWLVTGRHPLRVMVAAVYVAWQSLRPAPRMKVTLAQFCQVAKVVDSSRTTTERLKELKAVLCKLGAQLPWLRGARVEPRKIATLVEDIVKHRRLLLSMAMKSHEESLQASVHPDENATVTNANGTSPRGESALVSTENMPEVRNMSGHTDDTRAAGEMAATTETILTPGSVPAVSCSTHSAAQVDPPGPGRALPEVHLAGARPECLRSAGVKRKAGQMGTVIGAEGEDVEEEEEEEEEEREPPAGQTRQCSAELPEDHWGKRRLFVPPCILLPSKRPRFERGPDVTGDEEISDTEIESYIRTPAEIQDVLQTQRWFTQEEQIKGQKAKEDSFLLL